VVEVGLHRGRPGGVVGMGCGAFGEDGLGQYPGFPQFAVGGAGEVVVERRHPTEVGGVDGTDDRTATGTAADRDQALHLEQAQRLAQGLPADAVVLQHRRLGRQVVAFVEAVDHDVVDDVAGDALGRLERAQRRARRPDRQEPPVIRRLLAHLHRFLSQVDNSSS